MVRSTVYDLVTDAPNRRRDDILTQLEQCGVPSNEYVYSPKKPYLRMRANLWFPGTTEDQLRPKNYQAEMPILFLLKPRQNPPKCTPPRPREPNSKRDRASIPLMDTPIIASRKATPDGPDYTRFYRRKDPEQREYGTDT